MEENNIEQVTEETQEAQEEQQRINDKKYSQDQVAEMIKKRLAQERSQVYKQLGVEDLDIAVNAVKTQRELEEKQKIQKGEFEEILKNKTRMAERKS